MLCCWSPLWWGPFSSKSSGIITTLCPLCLYNFKIISKWSLCSLFPSSVLFTMKILPSGDCPFSSPPLSRRAERKVSLQCTFWEIVVTCAWWFWFGLGFFFSPLLCYAALKKRLSRSQLLHCAGPHLCFSKGSFLGCPCYIYKNYVSCLCLNLFFIAYPSSKTSFYKLFVEKSKGTLCLIAFQLSAVNRSFDSVKAMDQNFALWIVF